MNNSRELEFVQLGQIHQTHGLQGEVNVSFTDTPPLHRLIKKGMFCFIELHNQTYIPYKISTCSKTGLSANITFESFDNIDEAKKITGKKLYLHTEQIPKSYLSETQELWVNYEIYDAENLIGKVHSIIKSPGQVLAQVMYGETDILIPLNDDLITDIDHDKKIISMSIPEGLLDL